MNNLTVGFCGSGKFAAKCIEIISKKISIAWVITNVAKMAGRGLKIQNTPVFETAEKLNIPCFITEKLSTDIERVEWLRNNCPDVILVIDFGHIIKEPILSMPKIGCINIHPSRLPEYRGSAPLQRAIMDGCKNTAVTVFKLDEGMDSGKILAQAEIEISDNDTYNSLLEHTAEVGSDILLHYLCEVPFGEWKFYEQDHSKATFAPKIDKTEGKIDWQNENARRIFDKIRAIGSSIGVFTFFRGKRVRILDAKLSEKNIPSGEIQLDGTFPLIGCSTGSILITQIQPEGKKVQSASDWLRGARITAHEKFD